MSSQTCTCGSTTQRLQNSLAERGDYVRAGGKGGKREVRKLSVLWEASERSQAGWSNSPALPLLSASTAASLYKDLRRSRSTASAHHTTHLPDTLTSKESMAPDAFVRCDKCWSEKKTLNKMHFP
eukprot:CAMPEP_0179451756 /NCGR_PEP_ID=MMETSP0799-20121207/35824_1 /TAXON_ID=46947 /ORGANISM="Geminigera cryophila, Strain CCMP2564" /LENGTH=124 /DNA_ID=CAMNT_0021247361 /DNA_START=138 /DNA_END=508 /DNA_ORIENTATION=+